MLAWSGSCILHAADISFHPPPKATGKTVPADLVPLSRRNSMAHSWTCPFCTRPTTLTDIDIKSGHRSLFEKSKIGNVGIAWDSARCPNSECREVSLIVFLTEWLSAGGGLHPRPGMTLEAWTLRPESLAKPLRHYIPAPIQEDYREACLIAEKSPKASATLSRRCLQGMIRDYWKIKKNRLIDEINALEERVDASTWEAIKAVKDVGNIGAHMEKDINHITLSANIVETSTTLGISVGRWR